MYVFDLPTVSPKVRYQKHRYVYGAGIIKPTSSTYNSIVKLDVAEGKVAGVWKEQGSLNMEPVFVPRPDGEEEDDGVVVGHACTADGIQWLIVLDG